MSDRKWVHILLLRLKCSLPVVNYRVDNKADNTNAVGWIRCTPSSLYYHMLNYIVSFSEHTTNNRKNIFQENRSTLMSVQGITNINRCPHRSGYVVGGEPAG